MRKSLRSSLLGVAMAVSAALALTPDLFGG